VVTDPQTHTPTNKQTHRQDRLQYTAPQLAHSVKTEENQSDKRKNTFEQKTSVAQISS